MGAYFYEPFYDREALKVDIEQTETNVCWKMTNATLNLTTNSYFGAAVTWYSDPAGISGSAAAIAFNPSALSPTTYVVTAWANEFTNCSDVATVRVFKVDIEQVETNLCWQMTNAALNLMTDSYLDGGTATWESDPSGISGSGTNITFNPNSLSPTTFVVKAYSSLFTNCYDTCTVRVIKVDLTNMTFSGGWDIVPDTGGTYPTPHWTPTSSSPYLYQCSSRLNTTATFKVAPGDFTGNITLSGDGPGNLDLTNTVVAVTGSLATFPATDSTGTLTNRVDFWNPLQINWKYGIGGNASYDAGQTSNKVYVCLANAAGLTLYHTVVHLACSYGHATNTDAAASNTWTQFTSGGVGPADVTTWDDQPLHYYQAGTPWANNVADVGGLLSAKNGQCNSWRELLEAAWEINGIASQPTTVSTVVDPGTQLFLVKNWGFGTETLINDPPYNYSFLLNASDGSMVGVTNFGDVANQAGVSGQSSATPAEKAFGYHFIQKLNGLYYDPSYGVTYTNDAEFQAKAVAGYGRINPDQNVPGRLKFGVKQASTNIEIQLVP